MRLVYKDTGAPVRIGDVVKDFRGNEVTVMTYARPHKPASNGFVSLKDASGYLGEFYVGVIDAEWIEREDREGAV